MTIDYKEPNRIRFRIDYKAYANVIMLNNYSAKLETIITERKFRNRGFATKLMDEILNHLKKGGISLVKLEIHPLDKDSGLSRIELRNFYKKFGFVSLSKRLMVLEFN